MERLYIGLSSCLCYWHVVAINRYLQKTIGLQDTDFPGLLTLIFILPRRSLMFFPAANRVESILSSSLDKNVLLHFSPNKSQKYLLIFIQ